MTKQRFTTAITMLVVIALCHPIAAESFSQVPDFKKSKSRSSLRSSLGGRSSTSPANMDNPVSVKAQFKTHAESRTGILEVTATIAKSWHINSVTQPKGGPIPTKISLGESEAVSLVGKFKPDQEPHAIDDGTFSVPMEQHSGTVTWSVPIKFSGDGDLTQISVPVKFFYQACAKSCLQPTTAKVKAVYSGELAEAPSTLRANSNSTREPNESKKATSPKQDKPTEKVVTAKIMKPTETPEEVALMAKYYNPDSKINYVPLYKKAQTTLVTALLGAFVGGFLLNLMPCVFPVLGIKVMGFVEQAGSSPTKIRLHGLAFTAGLVVSMWALAGFILSIKLSAGKEVNWGQQMGSPYFVAAIIVLLFLMGLNMAGVFEFGTSMTRIGGSVQSKKGYGASFLSGVLTTLIATPCSGPFLGAAMGYTLAQPPGMAMLLFTVLALGIALPYLVLSMSPSLIKLLPRPGAWMETFKVAMAFLIFAAVVFFSRTFGGQTGVEGLSLLLMALVVIGLAAYFYGHWSQPHLSSNTRYVWGMALPSLIAGAGVWMTITAAGNASYSVDHGEFRPWKPGIVEYQTAEKNRAVLVDYTAEWCATCQVNEKRVFSNQLVKNRLNELGVLLVAADMTDMDQAENVVVDLARADRNTISTYLIYPASYPEDPAILLEELISPDDVLKALDRIAPKRNSSQARHESAQQKMALR